MGRTAVESKMPPVNNSQAEKALDKKVNTLIQEADSQIGELFKHIDNRERGEFIICLTETVDKYVLASKMGSLRGYLGLAVSWNFMRGVLHPESGSEGFSEGSFYSTTISALKAAGNGYLKSLSDISGLPLSEREPLKLEKVREELEAHLKLALECFVNHDFEAQLKRIPYGLLPLVSLYLGREFITVKKFKEAKLYLKMVDVLVNDLGCMDTDNNLSQTILSNAKTRLAKLLIYTEALTEDELYEVIIKSFEELKKHQVHGSFESISDALPEFISQSKITLAKTFAYISMHPNSSLAKFASQTSALSKDIREITQHLDLRIHSCDLRSEDKDPPGMRHKNQLIGIITHRHVFEDDTSNLQIFYKRCDWLLEEIREEKLKLKLKTQNQMLSFAASKGDVDEIERLINSGASYKEAGSTTGKTALHRASEWGHLNVVSLLVGLKVDLNAQDKDGNTCLMLAIKNKRFKLAAYILQLKIDFLLKNKDGKTAFNLLAVERNRHGATLNQLNDITKVLEKARDKIVEYYKDKCPIGHAVVLLNDGNLVILPESVALNPVIYTPGKTTVIKVDFKRTR